MNTNNDTTVKRVVYGTIVVIFLIFFILMTKNNVLAIILTIDMAYMVEEVFHKQLYPNKVDGEEKQDKKIEQRMIPRSEISKDQTESLPDNVRSLITKAVKKQQELSIQIQPMITTTNTEGERILESEALIVAFQKAEELLDKKIEYLKKHRVKKEEVIKVQKELKEELIKEIPLIDKEKEWTTWSPAVYDEKLLNLAIFCENCQKTIKVKDMNYEITTTNDITEIKTTHEVGVERHVHLTKVKDYEILSKPALLVEQALPHVPVERTNEIEA